MHVYRNQLKPGRFWFNNCLQQLQLCSDSAINFFAVAFGHCVTIDQQREHLNIHLDALLNHSGAEQSVMTEAATTIAKSSSSRALHLPTSNFQAAAVVVVVSFYWQSAQAFVASPWTTPSPPPLPPASPSLSSSSFLSCAAVNFVVYWLWPTISFAPRLIIHSVGRVSHLIEPCIIFGPLLAPWAKGLSVSVCSYNRAWFVIWFLFFFEVL